MIPGVVVDIECSAAAPCPDIRFNNFAVQAVNGSAPNYICKNVLSESGLNGRFRSYSEECVCLLLSISPMQYDR
jgi:hypothetical protein